VSELIESAVAVSLRKEHRNARQREEKLYRKTGRDFIDFEAAEIDTDNPCERHRQSFV
jgi:hypothetical protein